MRLTRIKEFTVGGGYVGAGGQLSNAVGEDIKGGSWKDPSACDKKKEGKKT